MFKYLRISVLILVPALMSACDNDENISDLDNSSEACELQLKETTMNLTPGETKKIPLTAKAASETYFKVYNWQKDIYQLTVTCDNPEIIKIDDGFVESLGPLGETVVTITPKKGESVKFSVVVDDLSYRKVYNINKPLTADNIFLAHVCTNKWIQSFEFNSRGDVYVLSTVKNDPWLSVFRYTRNGEKTGEMRLAYASHATTCSLEETPDGDYIWLPTYGTKNSSNEYKRDQLFSRVKFEDGKEWLPDDPELQLNSYYLGDYDNLLPSIDFKNGHIGIRYMDLDDNHWVAVYDLKEIADSPINRITLKQSIKRGGESTGPIKGEEIVNNMSFNAHDCSAVKPLYRFRFNTEDALGNSVVSGAGHALQGFCIDDGYAYITYGWPVNFDGGYSVYDYSGKQVVIRQRFPFLLDRENLRKLKIADTKFEPEGVRVKNGRMYLGAGVHLNNEALETILILPN